MNIVVIGATSFIGARIASAFARDNDLFLTSRVTKRLDHVMEACRNGGARSVVAIEQDLKEGTSRVFATLDKRPIDIVINVASSTSRLRDDEIANEDFESHVAVDLLKPLCFAQQVVTHNNGHPVHIILISSFLTQVKSPNRSIYSSLKTLQEEYLKRIEATRQGVRLTIVRVSRVIPVDHDSVHAAKLARSVFEAYSARRKTIYFGTSGVMLLGLFYSQPVVFRAAMMLQRLLRGRKGRSQ